MINILSISCFFVFVFVFFNMHTQTEVDHIRIHSFPTPFPFSFIRMKFLYGRRALNITLHGVYLFVLLCCVMLCVSVFSVCASLVYGCMSFVL